MYVMWPWRTCSCAEGPLLLSLLRPLLLTDFLLRFSSLMVFSSSPAALLLAAPSLALLVLVARGMKPALPLSRPAWPPYL